MKCSVLSQLCGSPCRLAIVFRVRGIVLLFVVLFSGRFASQSRETL